jgi:TusA-related sulfurtransferase
MYEGIMKHDEGLEFNFTPVKSMEEIIKIIHSTPKPYIKPDKILELGSCGMGMPVIKSHWLLSEMKPGEVLRADSSHACSFSDIHAFARRSKRVKLVALDINGEMMSYYLQVI